MPSTWTEEQLAALPVRNGVRQRGRDMTRLETFCDAAFAFAAIAYFWWAHRTWSRRYGLEKMRTRQGAWLFLVLTLPISMPVLAVAQEKRIQALEEDAA